MLGLEDMMPFGKHRMCQIEDLVYDEPGYMRWLAEDTDTDLDQEVLDLMVEQKII